MLANGARNPSSVAIEAYAIADAMMEARKYKGENHGS
jgi:hypothetical protein